MDGLMPELGPRLVQAFRSPVEVCPIVRRSKCLCVIVLASCKADLEIPPALVSVSVMGAVDTDPAETNVAPGGITVELIDDDGLERSSAGADGGFAHVLWRSGRGTARWCPRRRPATRR